MKIKVKIGILFFILCTSCATYTKANEEMRQAVYRGDIPSAIAKLESTDLKDEKNNYALYRMEKGMLTYLNNNYKESIPLWVDADKHLDDLYTLSLSKTAASFLVNDSVTDYEGESHERMLIPIFSSVAFLADGNKENAAVMIRRANEVFNVIQDSNSKEKNSKFKYDAFSYYFAGVVFETRQEWDNAIISYRKSLENSEKLFRNGQQSQSSQLIASSLLRLAKMRNRNDLLTQYSIYLESPYSQKIDKNYGVVYIILESGRVPIKVEKEYIIPINNQIERISFPVYEDVSYSSHYCDVNLDGNYAGRTVVLENIGEMAKKSLEDRRVRDFAKMTARLIAKHILTEKLAEKNQWLGLAGQVYSAVSETADTRSWTTLPDTLQVLPVVMAAHQPHTLNFRPQNGGETSVKIQVNPGEIKIYRFRTYQ